jgi:protein involved in polysaccharide export with SLBB domain
MNRRSHWYLVISAMALLPAAAVHAQEPASVQTEVNPDLRTGGTVVVERLPSVGVVGCVADGGWFYIRNSVTLTQAVAMAGGPTRKAHRAAILRQNPPSPSWPVVIQANLDSISKGKTTDPVLESGDTVEVFRKAGDMCGVHVDW